VATGVSNKKRETYHSLEVGLGPISQTVPMGSKYLLSVLWLLGTVVAAVVAWQSLRFVSASTEGDPTTAVAVGSGSDGTSVTVASDGTVGSVSIDAEVATSATVTRTVDDGASTTAPTTPTSSKSSASSDSDLTTSGSASTEQVFDLIGGQAAIRFSPAEVVLVWATPADGYSSEIEYEDGGVEVKFENGVHESKIEAWWNDGPRSDIRERKD